MFKRKIGSKKTRLFITSIVLYTSVFAAIGATGKTVAKDWIKEKEQSRKQQNQLKAESAIIDKIIQQKMVTDSQRQILGLIKEKEEKLQEEEKKDTKIADTFTPEFQPFNQKPDTEGKYDHLYQEKEQTFQKVVNQCFGDRDDISYVMKMQIDSVDDENAEFYEEFMDLRPQLSKLNQQNVQDQTKIDNNEENLKQLMEGFTPLFKNYKYQLSQETLPSMGNMSDEDLERCANRVEQHLDQSIKHLNKIPKELKNIGNNMNKQLSVIEKFALEKAQSNHLERQQQQIIDMAKDFKSTLGMFQQNLKDIHLDQQISTFEFVKKMLAKRLDSLQTFGNSSIHLSQQYMMLVNISQTLREVENIKELSWLLQKQSNEIATDQEKLKINYLKDQISESDEQIVKLALQRIPDNHKNLQDKVKEFEIIRKKVLFNILVPKNELWNYLWGSSMLFIKENFMGHINERYPATSLSSHPVISQMAVLDNSISKMQNGHYDEGLQEFQALSEQSELINEALQPWLSETLSQHRTNLRLIEVITILDTVADIQKDHAIQLNDSYQENQNQMKKRNQEIEQK